MSDGSETLADCLESEAGGHHRDHHRHRSHVEQLLASPFLNQVDRRESEEHVDRRDRHHGEKTLHPRVAEDGRRVVDHHVDADELLEHLQQNAYEQNLEEVAAKDDSDPGSLRAVERFFDFADLPVDFLLGVQRFLQYRDRLIFSPLEHQPPGTLGEDESCRQTSAPRRE